MEKFTVTAVVNGGHSQRPSYEMKEISPSYTSFPSKPPLREVSFSSCLRPELPKPVPEERQTDDTEISIFNAEKYFNDNPDRKENKKLSPVSLNLERIVERCELSTVPRLSSVSSVDGYGRNYRTGSFHATPTASSEASWNSQSGLLSHPPGSIAVSIKNLPIQDPKKRSARRWLFGRKCPCSGKKSVDVEEKISEAKTPNPLNCNSNGILNTRKQSLKTEDVVVIDKPIKENMKEIEERATLKLVAGNQAKEPDIASHSDRFSPEIGHRIVPTGRSFNDAVGSFSFPILNASAYGKQLNGRKSGSPPDDPPRESLEVFHPIDETVVRKSMDFQRRLLLSFPGDNARRSFTFSPSPKTRTPPLVDDDVASDSSSDLFEIESFSTQTTSYPMYRRRDSLDELTSFEAGRFTNGTGKLQFRRSLDETTTQSIAPTEGYEPSEVSVDWSVTTAEGFDRASVANFSTAASEYEEVRFIQTESKIPAPIAGASGRRRGNGLLSCQCEKAVSIGPHPVKCGTEHRRVSPPQYLESGRVSAAVVRMANVSSDKPPLGRSHSARLSRSLGPR